ncbi:unnamed protein product [Soboliphyme baturini]|uniref:Endo/exonuclease/phosphatase domain-containing protein n=1 Tax=Soboliphyme baturini TaxID=241478 RepID=A0A183J1V6_9BILA|nr:unnamed protein product [Soboliphyme baturini]
MARAQAGVRVPAEPAHKIIECKLPKKQVIINRLNNNRILNLCWWKLFYSGVDITARAQPGVGVLLERNQAERIIEWKPVSRKVAILQLQQQQAKALTLLQVYVPNLEEQYKSFLEETEYALKSETGVIGKNGPSDLNNNGIKSLRFCASNGLHMMSIFEHRKEHQYAWYWEACAQKSMIDLIIVSSDLRRSVVDDRLKRGAEPSADHHLVVAVRNGVPYEDPVAQATGESNGKLFGGFENKTGKNISWRFELIPGERSFLMLYLKWFGLPPGGQKRTPGGHLKFNWLSARKWLPSRGRLAAKCLQLECEAPPKAVTKAKSDPY